MKNQYFGDIGDYGKYALLRALIKDYTLGVNWYLTKDDNRTDGRFTEYLDADSNTLDDELFQMLKKTIRPNKDVIYENRRVSFIENSTLLSGTTFFSEMLDFSGISLNKTHRELYRKSWVDRSLTVLGNQDIMFLDPDNGLEINSVPQTRKNGVKYVAYNEACRYYEQARVALIIYNHRDRKPEEDYVKRFTRLYEDNIAPDSFVYRLSFNKVSKRDYIFITKPKYLKEIYDFIHSFANARKEYFSVGNMPMPLTKRWAFDDAPKVYTQEEWEKKMNAIHKSKNG